MTISKLKIEAALFAAIVAGVITLIAPGLAFGEGYTLNQALMDAHLHDPRISGARSAVSSAEEGVNQAYGLSYPSISGFGAASLNDTKTFNDQGTLQQDAPRASVGIEVNQPIYSFGRFQARRARAAAEVTGAQSYLQNITLQVYFDVGEAFAAAKLAEDVFAVHENHHQNMLTLYEATEAKFEVDLTTATDVRLVRSRLEQADAERVSAASRRQAAFDRLSRLTNQDIEILDGPSMDQFMTMEVPNKDDAIMTALTFSPIVHGAQADEMAAEAEMNLNASERWPSLGVRGRTSRGVMDGRVIGSDEIGIVLNIPLWDGGITNSRARAGRHRFEQSRQNLRNTQDQVQDDVTSAWHNIRGSQQALLAWLRAVAAEEATIDGIQEEVDEGLRPITHLLEAKEDMVVTSTRALNTGFEAFVARLLLEKEMGTLDQHIAEIP